MIVIAEVLSHSGSGSVLVLNLGSVQISVGVEGVTMTTRRFVLDLPEELSGFGEAIQRLSREVRSTADKHRGQLSQVNYAEIEKEFGRLTGDIEREGHRHVLAALEIEAKRIRTKSGVVYANVGRHEATYYTAVGPVGVMRSIFRPQGERNGKTVDAVTMRTGALPGGWLPQTANAMGHLVQQGTSREAESSAREIGRLPYSRSSFEDVAHALGATVVEWQDTLESILVVERVPAEVRSVSVAMDRVSVPMEEPRNRPAGRPRKNAPKRPIDRVYRMAWCGTATLHDGEGRAVRTVRLGDMPDANPDALAERLLEQVRAWLREDPTLKLVRLADGAPQLWDVLRRHFNEETLGTTAIHEHIDVWHVLEHLAVAAAAISDDADGTLKRWRMLLFNTANAGQCILDELCAIDLRSKSKVDREDIKETVTYLTNHVDRLNYSSARALGLPCGSGNVEATCKSLVAQRMKRSGARWKNDSGREILHLRSLALSDHWSPAMHLLFTFRQLDLAA